MPNSGLGHFSKIGQIKTVRLSYIISGSFYSLFFVSSDDFLYYTFRLAELANDFNFYTMHWLLPIQSQTISTLNSGFEILPSTGTFTMASTFTLEG